VTEFVEFKSEHVRNLLNEPEVEHLRPYYSEATFRNLERLPFTMSIAQDGVVVASGGVSPYYSGRGIAWVFFHHSCRRNFRPVFRLVKQWLDDVPVRRIEAAVRIVDSQAHRWVRLLGFELEAPVARCFEVNGDDCALYARVK